MVALSAAPLWATEVQVTLTDGSIVRAEIESVHAGVYTLRSAALGTMTVKQADIRRIEMSPVAAAQRQVERAAETLAPAEPSAGTQVEALQREILESDAARSSLGALQNDPEVQALLADPDITAALRAGDFAALARNPKFRSLLDNPAVQDISRQLQR